LHCESLNAILTRYIFCSSEKDVFYLVRHINKFCYLFVL
jgi:hypothetical protein